MKKLLILMLLMPVVAFAQVREDGSFRTVLRGTVTNPDCKDFYVMPFPPENPEIHSEYIIPVVDGKFEYVLEGDYVREYILVFLDRYGNNGHISGPRFFPDAEIVEFTMNNPNNSTVSGGEINRTMNEYFAEEKKLFGERRVAIRERRDYLLDNELYYNEEYNDVVRQIYEFQERDEYTSKELERLYKERDRLLKDDTGLTPDAAALMKRYYALIKEANKWKYEFMTAHPDLFSLSLLIDDITTYHWFIEIYDIADMKKAYAALSAANPDHPYNRMAEDGLFAITNLVQGSMFIDFSAPALDGTMHTLSEEIKGKIAVIDLWASWCGPCRRSGMEIIPIYEKYKDRGFTVVGVAREYKKTDDLVIALKRDGYPWLNLLELDDRAGIWMKYGANNSAGRKILVDENGRIVKLDVTTEEIIDYLSSRLD